MSVTTSSARRFVAFLDGGLSVETTPGPPCRRLLERLLGVDVVDAGSLDGAVDADLVVIEVSDHTLSERQTGELEQVLRSLVNPSVLVCWSRPEPGVDAGHLLHKLAPLATRYVHRSFEPEGDDAVRGAARELQPVLAELLQR